MHVNTLITAPGTVELDFGAANSFTTRGASVPLTAKYTPAGDSLLAGQTEYSVSVDALSSSVNGSSRVTQFSDHLTFAATAVIFASEHVSVAVAPQVTGFLRGESGSRAGTSVLGRLDVKGNSLGVSATWTGATVSSDTNPAGLWDLGIGFGRPLASSGLFHRVTPHFNRTWEKATRFAGTVSTFFGIEYQPTQRLAVDVLMQNVNVSGGIRDHQLLLGLTVNLGHLK